MTEGSSENSKIGETPSSMRDLDALANELKRIKEAPIDRKALIEAYRTEARRYNIDALDPLDFEELVDKRVIIGLLRGDLESLAGIEWEAKFRASLAGNKFEKSRSRVSITRYISGRPGATIVEHLSDQWGGDISYCFEGDGFAYIETWRAPTDEEIENHNRVYESINMPPGRPTPRPVRRVLRPRDLPRVAELITEARDIIVTAVEPKSK